MATQYWLLKSEPGTYSFDDLVKDKKTGWDGVRNFQARNNLMKAKKGDQALIYHSVSEKAVVGVAGVLKEAYPDPDPKKKGDWVQIEIGAKKKLKKSVTLEEMKGKASLKSMALFKQSRLSVIPLTAAQFKTIIKMGS